MRSIIRIFLIIVPIFLLSSCMSMHATLTIPLSGPIKNSTTLDMSRLAALVTAMGTGSSSGTLDKDLCKDKNFQEGLSKADTYASNITCTSLGDYEARVESDISSKNLGVMFLSGGVVVVDALKMESKNMKDSSSKKSTDGDPQGAKDMGFDITETLILPGKISYNEAGVVTNDNTIALDLLDTHVYGRKSIIIIATPDGRKLSRKDINAYKIQLRKYTRSFR